LDVTSAFRQARALSLTRNARFCVYGYETVAGRWTYSFHARRPLCEQRDAPAHPARADRPCPVCGNYPSACTCRITDDSPRTYLGERFAGPTCNCTGTVHPIGEGACLLNGWED
jgi:hypothetical protein